MCKHGEVGYKLLLIYLFLHFHRHFIWGRWGKSLNLKVMPFCPGTDWEFELQHPCRPRGIEDPVESSRKAQTSTKGEKFIICTLCCHNYSVANGRQKDAQHSCRQEKKYSEHADYLISDLLPSVFQTLELQLIFPLSTSILRLFVIRYM